MSHKDDIAKRQKELEDSVLNDPRLPGITRRGFLQRAVAMASVGAAATALTGCAPEPSTSTGSTTSGSGGAPAASVPGIDYEKQLAEVYATSTYGHSPLLAPLTSMNRLAEPAIPEDTTLSAIGYQSEYDVDILVVGGGFAGIYAAREAVKQGKKTLLVDKGIVGHSGLTPWAHTFAYYDESLGDVKQPILDMAAKDSEYSAHLGYFGNWLDRSKEIYEDALEVGWLHPHDWATVDSNDIPPVQAQAHLDTDRRKIFRSMVVDNGIDFIERVMITDAIFEDGRIQGAVGFHVEAPSEPIVIKAKAIILCCGPGAVRPSGFPTGSSTWDGDRIAYNVGGSVGGKEYTDFHWTLADMPCDIYSMWWRAYLEGQLLFPAHFPSDSNMISDVFKVDAEGGFITPDRADVDKILLAEKEAIESGQKEATPPPDMNGELVIADEDPRKALGTTITLDYLWIGREVKECAIGMGLPKEEGVWPVDENGWSGVAGMWGAGDGLASCMCGSAYVCMGASSNASCLQGRMAAEDACKYVDTAPAANPSAGAIKALTDVLLKPMQSPVGFTPDWAEEVLCNIMAPYWVAYMKDETTLTAALHQVMMLQKKVIGNLRARSGHELRYCHEMVNKALNCEMKLRAGLFRTESRGMHYRYDYPFRDDDNWLAFVCIKKGANGEMELYKEPMNPEWCGDRSIPYLERYPRRFPNEPLGL